MKKLDESAMLDTTGGSRATAIIGGVSCALTLATGGIGALIFGPTCVGMIIGTIVD